MGGGNRGSRHWTPGQILRHVPSGYDWQFFMRKDGMVTLISHTWLGDVIKGPEDHEMWKAWRPLSPKDLPWRKQRIQEGS